MVYMMILNQAVTEDITSRAYHKEDNMAKVKLIKENPLDVAAVKVIGYFESGVPKKKIFQLMGYTLPTHYSRKKNPENMTLRELRIMSEVTQLPDEVIMGMIREDRK